MELPKLALALAVIAVPAAAQQNTVFPFNVPWDDAAKTVTDVSFLNPAPLTEQHRVVVRGGQFRDLTGRRVKFLGNNLTFNANFPNKADAPKIAARMRKLGFNIMRLHHMDFFKAPRGIFDPKFPDVQHLDAEQMDRLDWLLYQFSQHGIYADLNLHVSRAFTEADGFPDTDKLPTLGKVTAYFEPKMVQMQKDFARDLLNRYNPYTQKRWGDDPVFALIELNNEDTLVGEAFTGSLDRLPPHYKNILMTRWNNALKKKYASTDAMLKAWNGGETLGQNVLINSQFADGTDRWTIEQGGTSKAELAVEDVTGEAQNGPPPTGRALRMKTLAVSDQTWHVQAHQNALDLKAGQSYTVKFWARADKPRKISVYTGNDQEPWKHIGLDRNLDLTTQWKKFVLPFVANQDVIPAHSRLTWVLGEAVGDVWIADVSLRPGRGMELEAGETLEQGNVSFPIPEMPGAGAEFISVLMDIEREYVDAMTDYIKNDLNAKGLVTCSQASYGGVAGMWRENKTDFIDMHSYWQHPHFPRRSWDMNDWTIPNTSMTRDAKGGTLTGLAKHRIEGKPFTVSEYNHAAPSDYSAETLPLICAYAAQQDWDGVFLFDYHGDRDSLNQERIKGFFSTDTHPGKMAMMPAAAMLFLRGDVAPETAQTSQLLLPNAQDKVAAITAANGSMWNQLNLVWSGAGATKANDPTQRIGSRFINDLDAPKVVELNAGAASSGFRWLAPDSATPGLQVVSPSSLVFVSHYKEAGANVELGPAKLNIKPATPQALPFVAFTLNAIDGQNLRDSSRLLLTAISRVENLEMGWNETRTSVGNKWGKGPVQAEGVAGQIELQTKLANAQIWALDGTGARVKPISSELKDGVLRFTIGPEHKTLWYEISVK